MLNVITQHSFGLAYSWLVAILIIISTTLMAKYFWTTYWDWKDEREETDDPEELEERKRPWTQRWPGTALFALLLFSIDYYYIIYNFSSIRHQIEENDPLRCELGSEARVRMLESLQWTRNRPSVAVYGCNFNERLKVIAEQHKAGKATINENIKFKVESKNQIVVYIGNTNWNDYQDGEVVISIIDPAKMPTWRGSISELRAASIAGGRQLISLSRD